MTNDIPWINVKERLPKNNKDVIVWKKGVGAKKDYYSSSDGDNGWMCSVQNKVTHWVSIGNFNEAIKPRKDK